ncbi:MAG: universal stress protein [Nitrospirae bacterium]|nr:universal stress protein [Nitrospirota bacterium]
MEATKIKKLMKNVEDALAAATFAEEGQAETARSIMKEGRRVLLALKESRIDARTLKYALNTSRRIGADLDILHVTAPGNTALFIDPLLSNFESELKAEGIVYRMITRTGCLKQQIIDYTNSERDILFAVIESPHSLDVDCNKKDKTLSELWQKLKCPLVVVMDGARG